MEYATKMILVPPEMVLNKNKDNLNGLDREMHDILFNKSLVDDVKWKLYSQSLQRYLHHVNENSKDTPIPVFENEESKPKIARSEDLNLMKIMQKIPNSLKSKAVMLYERLVNEDSINWNTDGSVIINGEPIFHSSIVDLICNSVQNKNSKPPGWYPFVNQLLTLNIQKEYLGKYIEVIAANILSNRASSSDGATPKRAALTRARKKNIPYSPPPWKKFNL